MLIVEISIYPSDDMRRIVPPRKAGYYSNQIYNIIIVFNVFSFIARIIGSMLLLYFRHINKTIELRSI